MPALRRSNWKPLLEGRWRHDALEAVDAIAAVTHDAIESWSAAHADPSGANAHSLAWGRAGAGLFFAYRDAAQRHGDGDDAYALLNRSIEAMNESEPTASLFTGFAGVAWVSEHLDAMSRTGADDEGDDDPNADVDAALIEHLSEARPNSEWDLVGGLVGLGVYACERLPRPSGRRCLELVIARLADLAQPASPGISWPTPPGRPVADDGKGGIRYDLGVAHGIPGIIALLGLAIEAGVDVARCRSLLDGAVPWLLAQQLPPQRISCFPSHVGEGVEPVPSRCAWCYGDPGVAVALWGAARRAGVRAWEIAALEIARHAAAVRERRDDVRDAQLCHGAAGVGHLFHRLHRASGDAAAKAAATYWFERALGLREQGGGLAGFRTWSLERTLDGEWIEDPRFLTGVTGVGLALLAAATDVEPAWDRVMLASLPPR